MPSKQEADGIYADQTDYVDRWLEEVPVPEERARQETSPLTHREVSSLREALGMISWKASQTGPHHQALSEVPVATVKTLETVNKLVREVKKESSQKLWFGVAEALDRSDRSGLGGCLTGQPAQEVEHHWPLATSAASLREPSWMAKRRVCGSNGSEVQAITVGEDVVFLLRALPCGMKSMEAKSFEDVWRRTCPSDDAKFVLSARTQVLQSRLRVDDCGAASPSAEDSAKVGQRIGHAG